MYVGKIIRVLSLFLLIFGCIFILLDMIVYLEALANKEIVNTTTSLVGAFLYVIKFIIIFLVYFICKGFSLIVESHE